MQIIFWSFNIHHIQINKGLALIGPGKNKRPYQLYVFFVYLFIEDLKICFKITVANIAND